MYAKTRSGVAMVPLCSDDGVLLNKPEYADLEVQNTVNLYAQITNATPSITVNTNMNDESITVNSVASVSAGDVITIYEGSRFYQSIVASAAGNTVGLGSPLDYAFTIDADVYIGDWNVAVDGSVASKTARVLAPPAGVFCIHRIHVAITDDTAMDSAKFGGITALTNGILFRVVNGATQNLPLVVNNMGFSEQGFDIQYDPKAPAGVYGFIAKLNLPDAPGAILRIAGSGNDELQCIIRDNLTSLTMFNINIQGHVV